MVRPEPGSDDFWCQPRILSLQAHRVVVRIKLNYRTRNHLKSMYFGALCVGADVTGGLLAMLYTRKVASTTTLVFKDFKADFLKRGEDHVHFTCTDGLAIRQLVDRARTSGERETLPVTVVATCPSKLGEEPIARFILSLSLKSRV